MYKQRILPIDCLYEVIDAGSQTLRFLTPETCPVDPVEPPFVNPQPPTTDSGSEPQTATKPINRVINTNISDNFAVAINPTQPSVKGEIIWMPKGVKSYPPVYRQAELFSYVIGASILALLFTFGYINYKRKTN